MNQYITVSFKTGEDLTSIITALLMDSGFEGIEEQEDETIGSIPSELFNEEDVKEIFEKYTVNYSLSTVEQQNWNAAWERSFEPVIIDNFAAIRASFHQPVKGVEHDIIITPKMSFGTGHHATTFLMVQQMKELDFKNKNVIDFGTGTAVLAILAEKLGAQNIVAIDNDVWSIDNARENLEANSCSKVELVLANEMIVSKKVDVILANINLNVIVKNLEKIKQASLPETYIVLSGLLVQDKKQISELLTASEFHIIKIADKNNWIILLAKLK